jgi:hypothetical protein
MKRSKAGVPFGQMKTVRTQLVPGLCPVPADPARGPVLLLRSLVGYHLRSLNSR